ncbi:MAG: dephospho-CoA kinase [Alphaproteobacteria bacterium]
MFLLGLTGSIGMGKSETARMFERLGVPVYDADAAVAALYAKGGEAVAPVAAAFPGAVKDGAVDRAELSRALASDPGAWHRLEAIVHPLAVKRQDAFLAAEAARGTSLVVLDIPLLYETGAEKRVDAVLVVSAPPEIQRERALARLGMTAEKLGAILARQIPDVEKRRRADYVIETNRGLDYALVGVRRVLASVARRRSEVREGRGEG